MIRPTVHFCSVFVTFTSLVIMAVSTATAQIKPAPSIISITAVPSANSVVIAEPFEVRIEVTAPSDSHVTFVPLGEALGVFDVLDTKDALDVPVSPQQRRWTRTITLETLQLGNQTVPPVEVTVSGASERANAETFSTPPIKIEVRSILSSQEQNTPEQFRDIASEIPLSDNTTAGPTATTLVAIGTAIVAALALVIYFFFVLSANRPDRWCRRELKYLKREPIANSADFVEAATRLKLILQVKITGLVAASKQSQSTPDVLQALRTMDCEAGLINDVQSVLRCADRMKFASGAEYDFRESEIASLHRVIMNLDRHSFPPHTNSGGAAASGHGAVV